MQPAEKSPEAGQGNTGVRSDAGGDRTSSRSVTAGHGCLGLFLGLIFAAGGGGLLVWYGEHDSLDPLKLLVGFALLSGGVVYLALGFRFLLTSRPAPWLAGALTFVAPGFGQVYAREPKRALAIFLGWIGVLVGFQVTGVTRVFVGLIALVVLYLLFLGRMMGDAYRIARQQEGSPPKPHNLWSLMYLVVVLVAGYYARPLIGLQSFVTYGASMEPVILVGDRFFAAPNDYLFARPARGDLVIFVSPENPEILQIKRVIGLGGEDIEIRDKKVYIDSRPLADPWGEYNDPVMYSPQSFSNQGRLRDHFDPLKIPEGSVFVLGDNRDSSYDSRFWGPVPISSIRGRPLYVYWNQERWRYVFSDLKESRIGTSLR